MILTIDLFSGLEIDGDPLVGRMTDLATCRCSKQAECRKKRWDVDAE